MIGFILNIVAAGLTLGTGRTIPTVAAIIGLVGVVFGGLALFRSSWFRLGGPASIGIGLISAIVGGLHTAYAAGGVGTGNGLAGAVVAVVLGLISVGLGALSYSRARRTA